MDKNPTQQRSALTAQMIEDFRALNIEEADAVANKYPAGVAEEVKRRMNMICDAALSTLSETEPMLERCFNLFGWQGGTVHQATAEIERLLKSKNDGLVWAEKLKAMTAWLDENQPDVWRRGIWDAINDAQNRMTKK